MSAGPVLVGCEHRGLFLRDDVDGHVDGTVHEVLGLAQGVRRSATYYYWRRDGQRTAAGCSYLRIVSLSSPLRATAMAPGVNHTDTPSWNLTRAV